MQFYKSTILATISLMFFIGTALAAPSDVKVARDSDSALDGEKMLESKNTSAKSISAALDDDF